MRRPRLSVNEALIAMMIVAMEADGHAAPQEAERAERVIRRLPRFRREGRDRTGRAIARMKAFAERHDPSDVIMAAARAIPARSRRVALNAVMDITAARGGRGPAETAVMQLIAAALSGADAVSQAGVMPRAGRGR